jgi:hypothetical protein
MFGALAAFVVAPIRGAVRRAAFRAAFAALASAFALIALAGLAAAAFFSLEPTLGAVRASLAVSGGALVLALAASAPFWLPRRRPPPAPEPKFADVILAMTKSAPSLSPRKAALGAVLMALAMGLIAEKRKSEP